MIRMLIVPILCLLGSGDNVLPGTSAAEPGPGLLVQTADLSQLRPSGRPSPTNC